MKKTIYYNNFTDDVVTSKNQNYQLKKNFKWIHYNIFYKMVSYLLYYIFLLISLFYAKIFLHVHVKNKELLKHKNNYFLYGNHTQMIGDAFVPPLITFPIRPYFVVNKANLGVPFLGKLLPMLGAIVIPDGIHDMIKFRKAVTYFNEKHPIIIYPEAHVWPYYTGVRAFNNSAFQFAIEEKKEIFAMTTTYQKRRNSHKPKIVIYIDGPFLIDPNISKKANCEILANNVKETMLKRSQLSNVEYIKYQKKEG